MRDTIHRPYSEQQALLAELRSDDVLLADNALSVIYTDYAGYLESRARHFLQDATDLGCYRTPKDVVHDVFLNIWKKRKNIHMHYIWKYLEGCVRNACYNAKRNAVSRQTFATDSTDSIWDVPIELPSPHKTAEIRELRQILMRALNRLPDAEKAMFIDAYIHELPYAVIAPKYGYNTAGRVKSKMHEIRQRMQRYILACYSH